MFTAENVAQAMRTFAQLMAELVALFVGISFVVALLQVYVSPGKIQRLLSRPGRWLNAALGAALGAATPFCSCSTIPVLVGLLKSGAPFCGAVSFLLASPILNPAIVALFALFFGWRVTAVYAALTFAFAAAMGLLLDRMGFASAVKGVSVRGGREGGMTWERLEGSFWARQAQAAFIALRESLALFVRVLPFLLLGGAVGAFIHDFIPADLLARFSGASSAWAVPLASVAGIPMYIRVETMIPIAAMLIEKGVAPGVMVALILGGAGASIPEVLLLSSIFRRRMVVAFLLCVFTVATAAGYIINIIL